MNMSNKDDKQKPEKSPRQNNQSTEPKKEPSKIQPLRSMIFDHRIEGSDELAKRDQTKQPKKIDE